MSKAVYSILKRMIRFGFWCYYQEIRMHGLQELQTDKPLLILPNHQNALLDPLLIAAFAPDSPWFLTRADVFTSKPLRTFFRFLHMIPIYRLRDGRDTLGKNKAVFEECSWLLRKDKSIVMFPEANHNLRRRVRPLSKGFTRILFGALDDIPGKEIYVVPVGINFQRAAGFPDRVAFYFDDPFQTRELYDPKDERASLFRVRDKVASHLKALTTHIPDAEYDEVSAVLEGREVDFTRPKAVNSMIPGILDKGEKNAVLGSAKKITGRGWDVLFILLNLPVVLIWWALIKPRVSEPEFISTTRFLFALVAYPVVYLALLLILSGPEVVFTGIALHFGLNLLYVKFR